jgi:hypothetical protein
MNRLIKSTALGLSVLMGCSLCACGVTDSSLGQKTEINPGLWVEKEVALEPDPSDILALTTTTDGQLLCATVQSNGEASQKVDVLSSSDGYTWDTTPVYSVEVPGTCIEASLTESGVLVLIRTEDEEQIWYGAKETECSQVQPADSEVTDINNIQFVNSDSFLMAGRDTNNQSVAAIFSLRDGRMVTKVGAGTEWGGFAQHGDELAFISETDKLSTLKANGEIQEGNVEGLENIIAAYCDSQGNYYYADSEGIYRVAAGGTLKEEITPSSGFAFSVQGKVITNLVYFQDSFFCVVKDTSDDSAQLYSYTFDPDATPSEQIELTVWSLSDSPTVRRVLSEYQQQHNDIAIQYRFQAGEDGTQYAMTLWNETKEVLKTDLHSIDAQVVFYSGDAAIVFPAVYIQESAPGAVDVNGCAVSESIALDLFGSTDIVGQTLQIGDRNVQIRGVFQGQTNLAITAAQESDMLKNVELVGSPGGDLREMAVDYVTAAGLGTPDQICTGKTWGNFFVALCSIPLLVSALWLLLVGFRISLRFPSWLRITIWFAVLFVFALLLPYLLGQIPSWLLPAQWSNLGFWPDLVNILNERLNETLSLVPTTRDVFAKRQAIEFTLWLLACLGALGLSVRVLKQR